MQSNRTCPLVEQYLGYLTVIKGRSENTIKEYLHISATSGHWFRQHPDSVTGTSGQYNGIIRTAFRSHPDTLSR